MGLTTQDVGVIYGTLVLALTRYFRRYCHFQRWIRKMDVTHDFSHALTHYRIHFTISFSPRFRFLYLCNSNRGTVCFGFGFAAFMMYLIYVADGESKRLITLSQPDLWL
jgi:PAT family beta-lactamase induction signal transducer AmpG